MTTTVLLTGFEPLTATSQPGLGGGARAGRLERGRLPWSRRASCPACSAMPVEALRAAIDELQPAAGDRGRPGRRPRATFGRTRGDQCRRCAASRDNAGATAGGPADRGRTGRRPISRPADQGHRARRCARRACRPSVSQTAGTFVCNHVFYGLMHAVPGGQAPCGPASSTFPICRSRRRATRRGQHGAGGDDRGAAHCGARHAGHSADVRVQGGATQQPRWIEPRIIRRAG